MLTKVTVGFVIQGFDPETKEFISQEFVCGDECRYEDDEHPRDEDDDDSDDIQSQFIKEDGTEPYLPYLMYQPGELETINELIDSFDGKCPENISEDLWERLRGITG